jgi:hypothetical protein
MLVFADTDRRYVINEPVKPFRTRGGIPLFWEASALLLPKSDPRCRLTVPDWNANRLSSARRPPGAVLNLDGLRLVENAGELVIAPG